MRKLGYDFAAEDPAGVESTTREFVRRSQAEPHWFWAAVLEDIGIRWTRPYTEVFDDSRGPAWTDWFIGGETNLVLNCVDQHLEIRADQLALISELEDGECRSFTYAELDREVCRVANALKSLGVGRGDTVACYMPMVAEVVFAMLGTQKIGAIFVPIFSGYAPPAVRERLEDGRVKVLFTADGSKRRGQPFSLKEGADEACHGLPDLEAVIVFERLGARANLQVAMVPRRDHWSHDVVGQASDRAETLSVPALEPALMIYTSGTTGKPKGTVHTHAGCLAQMGKELRYNFDLKPEDRFWWFSDIGWMMGPWEIIGCTVNAATVVVFEGAPNYPEPDRVRNSVEVHAVTQLGISPTAIRLLMRFGDEWVDRHSMPTLHTLGSTGEPWDLESYDWYFRRVGHERCPIINISGGTDIVGCFLAPLPVMPLKATSLQCAGLGMDVDVFNEDGESVVGEVGYLVCKTPAPSMTRSLWGNDEKYLATYWSKFEGVWNHGDWAKVEADGHWYLYGRADDTLKVAGRRVGPGEIESALLEHPAVCEAATIGVPDELKGTDIVCFVVLNPGRAESEELRTELSQQVVDALGKVDRPKAVLFVDDLPKTRSAKILRRLVKDAYLDPDTIGDLSSVANSQAIEAIRQAR